MSQKFLSSLTLANLAADPGSATAGDLYYNTGSSLVKYYNGSAWSTLSAGASVSGLTPAGIVYGSSTGTIASSTQGVAGQFLMSYGDIANGGPQWINVAAMESVTVATTTALVGTYANNTPGTTPSTFTLTSTGVLTIDGYTTVLGDRIIVKDQLVGSTPTYIANGIYIVTTAGATGVAAVLMRDNDADTIAKIAAMPISVDQGTTNGGLQWNCTNKTTDTMGTSAINFVKNNIGSGGVTQIVAGTNVTISPTGGTGVVTINSSGGGGTLGYTTTVTSASTVTLTASSTTQQFFTGSTAQTLVLPVTSTMALGNYFIVVNKSTSTIAVQSSGANLITTMPANTQATFTIIDTTVTTAAAWNTEYTGVPTVTGTGNLVLATSPTVTTPVIDSLQASSVSSTTTTTLYNNVTTGYVLIGEGVTSGRVNIANNTAFSAGQVNIASGAGGGNKTINIGNNGTGGTTAITLGSNAGSTSTVTINGTIASTTQTATAINGTSATTAMTLGGNTTTGSVSIANGTTFNGTVNVAAGAGTTAKTINIGTASTAGATAITIGSSSGATSTVTLNGTVTAGSSANKLTAYPANATAATSAQQAGFLGMPQNAQATTGTFAYTLVAADAGKHIYATGSPTSVTLTIPANGTVAYEIGTTIVFVNDLTTATNISIAITTDTMVLAGTGSTGTRTLAQYGMATLVKVTSTRWVISGNGLT